MSKLSSYINENLSIREEYKRIFNKELPEGKCFCPFHHNVNTPSAKVYQNRIKCFGQCQRSYTVYDLLERFNPQRIEEIKSTVLIPEESSSSKRLFKIITPDISLPKLSIFTFILHENGLSANRVQ